MSDTTTTESNAGSVARTQDELNDVQEQNARTYFREYADAAGLKPQDMPSPHHPLLESDAEVRELSDLIDVRQQASLDPLDPARVGADDPNLDLEEALTLPYKPHQPTSADLTPPLTDFDADARTGGLPDDADDESYMRRDDVEASMLTTDPDPNAGVENGQLADAGLNRAPDMTGTVQGIARGTSTHLPQDGSAGGFQIEEADELETSLVADPADQRQEDATDLDEDGMSDSDELEQDGGRIPVRRPDVDTRDEALDATRRIE